MSACGKRVDFIVRSANVPYLDQLPAQVRVIETGPLKPKARLHQLCDYLAQQSPAILLTAKIADDETALRAKARCGGRTRFFLRPGTALISRMRLRGANPIRRWLKSRKLRRLFRQADGIVTVSDGVAGEVAEVAGVEQGGIRVIRNPNITPEFYQLADEPLDDAWFDADAPPVIMGVGGLRRQKDFGTLIEAFAIVHRQRTCRLLILGQGRQHDKLQAQAKRLGLLADFRLGGFQSNPYKFLARARLFVLSSLWEGSPNVLTEALALGTPAVSTDCPSGPSEISAGGKYCRLVPLSDAQHLAEAMLQTLDNPPDTAWLKQAVQEYRMDISARNYIEAFGL